MTQQEKEKMFLDLNSVLVKFWIEQGRPDKEVKIELLERMLNWYKKMGYVIPDGQSKEPVSEDLEKYASRAGFDYVDDIENKYPGHRWNDHDVEFAYRDGIIAGAEWMKEKDTRDMYMSDNRHYEKVYELGKKDMKKKMLEEAVEGVMIDSLRVQIMAPLNAVIQREGLKDGDKMKILIVKEEQK